MTPSLLTYAIALYELMYERSHIDCDEHVYVGQVTSLLDELGIPLAFYSRLRRLLVSSGAITIRRGGRHGMWSGVVLHHRPDLNVVLHELTT